MSPQEILAYLLRMVDGEFDNMWLSWGEYKEICAFLDDLKESYE